MRERAVKKIAILTSRTSWFFPFAERLSEELRTIGWDTTLFDEHENIGSEYDTVFMLSYFRLVDAKYLMKHCYNLVVHESDLPKGRGWAPLFWQIIEGKNEIPVSLIDATEGLDEGPIYLEDVIVFDGTELHDDIRQKQANKTSELCKRFLKECKNVTPIEQKGDPTYYPKRTPKDSELDPEKSISEQFNLLRTVHNEQFPAFFNYRGVRYILHIIKDIEAS